MTSIIFQNIIDKITSTSKNINNYFDNSDYYNTNIYDIIYKMPKYNIIFYIFLVFIIYNFIARLNIRLNEVLSWIICLVVVFVLIKKDYAEFINYTNSKELQLKFLHDLMFNNKDVEFAKEDNIIIKPANSINKSYLYLNPLLVELFYNLRDYSQYNVSSYTNCLIHCNNVIGLHYQSTIGLNRQYYNYEMAIAELKKALNEFNSVIYNLPSSIMGYNKFANSINLLHGLLNKHILDMSFVFKNKNKTHDLDLYSMPDNFYEEYFKISRNDTQEKNYMSVFNVY